jgi:transposase
MYKPLPKEYRKFRGYVKLAKQVANFLYENLQKEFPAVKQWKILFPHFRSGEWLLALAEKLKEQKKDAILIGFDEDESMVKEILRKIHKNKKLEEIVKIMHIDMETVPVNDFLPGYSFHLIAERIMLPEHKDWRNSLEKLLSKLKKKGAFCYFELGGDAWNVRGEFSDLLVKPNKKLLNQFWGYYFQERTKVAPDDAESVASLLIRWKPYTHKESKIAFWGNEMAASDYHALKTYLRKRRCYKECIEKVFYFSEKRTYKDYLSIIEEGTYSWLRALTTEQRKKMRQIMDSWLIAQKVDLNKEFMEDNVGFVSLIWFE